MENQLILPVEIENFKEIRKDGYYYVDKTVLIEQVLEKRSKVTLFTRPRRFGKSLNMSMLQYFFEMGTDSALFDGLHISKNVELCERYMGKYPVISISLKGIDAANYDEAERLTVQIINDEAERFQFLLDSEKLTEIDKMRYEALIDMEMQPAVLAMSLKKLTTLLEKTLWPKSCYTH